MSTGEPYRRRGGRDGSVRDDRRSCHRRVTRNGNSLTIAIPPEFLRALSLLAGDEIEEILDPSVGGIFVRPVHARPIGPRPLPLEPEAAAPELTDDRQAADDDTWLVQDRDERP